ncbi:uncharacterized protein LOC132924542 [Rhopalosiphum padi]|uniref:uncharacterized protein LOC132924542 n=1 Tax=Rhopalosiphum padi TaxID=40932 RepID=UPI00298D8A6D|nr:uncharacterized protein LOC132924542 [Rhopalosiphum padi]
MTPEPLELIDTEPLNPFKNPRLVHEGYLYYFHKKCNHHLRWKCSRVYSFKCPAVLKTNLDMLNLKCIAIDHEHVHGNDLIAVEELKLKLRINQISTLFKKNTCFKSQDLEKFDEEIHSPDNMLDNKLASCSSSMNQMYFIDPLDPNHENGDAKCEEIIKINNSKDTSFNFENCPYTELQQQNNQKLIIIENGITGNHTNNSSPKKCIKKRRGRPPKEKNMIVSEKKENDTQNNEFTLLTNTHKETNILTTDPHKEINNLTTNTQKVKNSLISNVHKNNNTCILTKNNSKGKKSLVSGIKNKKNMSTANSNTSKRSLTTNTHTKKNIITTHKQKNKNSLIPNVNGIKISSKVNSNTIKNAPIIISTSTITSTSTALTTTIICTPNIESTFLIECTPTIKSTPTVTSTPITESLPSIKMPHTIERCMNKSIDYEDDIIIISDNEDNDSNFNFCEVDNEEVNNEINEINKIDLKDYESMIFTDLKKNWPTILKKMSDPLTGSKVI